MQITKSQLAALVAKGITGASPEADLKKAFFGIAGAPLSKAGIPIVVAALNGDTSNVIEDSAAPAAKPAKTPKEPKAPKAPAAPKEPRVVETADAALARLKADPATSARWAKVQSVDEMGKRGPVKVTIVCEDKGPEGQALTRQIKVQDLFQVRFSAGYAKKNARKSKAAKTATAPATA